MLLINIIIYSKKKKEINSISSLDMNHLIGLSRRTFLLTNRLPIQTSIRTALNNREWRPNEEAPVTVEDRAATARKYNMLPEDYKPYPPEYNAGDMPNVAPAGRFFDRSPWEDYDYPMDRQNWNEPRHPDDHIKYDKTRLGQGAEKQPIIMKELLKLMLIPVAFILATYVLRSMEFMNPTFRSPKPEPGAVHYSFEKKDDSGLGVRY
jgi:NADH dehydrogenase (ubiquinone) 1 beta subcomplex subunit 8